MTRVAILANPHVALFELGCAVELFALPRPEMQSWYHTEVVCFTDASLIAPGGLQLNCKQITDLHDYDMLVVPNWSASQTEVASRLKHAIIELHQRGGRLLSFCSGAFLLGHCGLLDDKQATTHWRYGDIFQQTFKRTHYVDDVLYIYDGQIGCSAGSASAIDLGIEVIRGDYGHEIANQVARRLVLPPHRSGGQSQFVETPVAKRPDQFAQTLDWAVNNLAQGIDVNELANKANMSRRSFDRKFRAAMGMSAKVWLTQQKVHLAKQLLESSPNNIDYIAQQSGFDSALNLRLNFQKILKLSPSRYRDQFGRGILPTVHQKV